MTSTPDRPSAAPQSPSSGRRFFNRLTSPFGNKARNIPEFDIKADDPHKQYGPGDVVTGSVRLRVTKPTRVTHIIARLHGYAQVHKNPGSPGEAYRANPAYLTTHRGSKSGEYFGNGFASLFEDEVVLCGDGRIAEGAYQFNFELEFPDRDLPSSIEFERGTICYQITAVFFMERIDIAGLYPPKPSTIILEPVNRRMRAKAQARKLVDPADKRSRKSDSHQQGSDLHRNSEASSVPTSSLEPGSPGSSGPSEHSFHSGEGGSLATASQYEVRSQMSPSVLLTFSRTNTSKTSLPSKTITAVIESQAGGCLRGDTIPVTINISHTKQVKSLHGVIVTLYRVARVDMRPSIPLGPTEKGKDAKFEEYYPKSITGLGGLSLSGAGSSHVFRKDLSQTMAPLYVDPHTLSAEINAKVRVPEEAFPTISTVPGQMISFKYYVEVVLDVQGRLAGQDRTFSSLAGQPGLLNNNSSMDAADMDRSAFTPFGSTIIDTASIRRDKGVVSCTFEVIIGTRDSERKKGKRKMVEVLEAPEPVANEPQRQIEPQTESQEQAQQGEYEYDWYDPAAYHDPRYYEYQYWYYQQHGHFMPEPPQQQSYDVPPPLPVPQPEDESQMSEKDRIRQAETRLLPSQPPGIDGQQAESAYAASAPTAPYLLEENGAGPAPPPWHAGSRSQPVLSGSSTQNGTLTTDEHSRVPSVPAYEPADTGSSAHAVAAGTDDKQELHRQQLQAAASAPILNEDDEAGPSTMPEHAPSAPTLAEAGMEGETVHDSHADALGESSLPRYER